MTKLTLRQELFVAEYLVDLNAKQAAIRAGYSARTAEQQAYQLLQKTSVANAISTKVSERAAMLDVSAERVLRGLLAEATFFGEGSSHGARVSAWGLLGKYHSLFVDKAEVTITHRFGNLTDAELFAELVALVGGVDAPLLVDADAARS